MKNSLRLIGIIALAAFICFGIIACGEPGGGDGDPENQTPVKDDYVITKLDQTVGSIEAVSIVPKTGKSTGTITIYYEGTNGTTYSKSTNLPTLAGTYAVTFDVAAVTGWNAATGLSAGNLTIHNEPVAPSAPLNFAAVPGNAQVALSWAAPDSNGGSEITGYEVTRDNWVNTVTKTASELSHTFTDLTNGTEYTFKVRAVNAIGNGTEDEIKATPTSNKSVSVVGTQAGTLTAGVAGNVTFTITTVNIANGTYTPSVTNLPTGVSVSGNVTINNNSGTLTLAGNVSTTAGITSTLTLTLDETTSDPFTLTVSLQKTVSVGPQVGTIYSGTAGTVTFPVTTENISNGSYTATLANAPAGISVSGNVTISGNSGTLTLAGNVSTIANTYNTIRLTIDGIQSGTFTLIITKGMPANTYVILGNGTTFTATYNYATIGTANQPIQTVINAIQSHAGSSYIIQFGDGDNELDLGTAYIVFNGGTITLSGKVTSAAETYSTLGRATIALENGASIISTADIKATSSTGNAIQNSSTGKITISGGTVTSHYNSNDSGTIYLSGSSTNVLLEVNGGTVQNTNGRAIFNNSSGVVNINNGTVAATGYTIHNHTNGSVNVSGGKVENTGTTVAIYNWANGKITVSGTAFITSRTTVINTGTITLRDDAAVSGVSVLVISGGTIENTSTGNNGMAILNHSQYPVEISSGTIRTTATNGKAIQNGTHIDMVIAGGPGGPITITGGTISATGTGTSHAVYNNSVSTITIHRPPTVIDPAKTFNNSTGSIVWVP